MSGEMDTTELAKTFRDWMGYRNNNYLFKITVSKCINSWNDPRKNSLKLHLKHLLTKTTVDAWKEIMTIYSSLVPLITEDIVTDDGEYVDWRILKSNNGCTIYTARLNGIDVIVKTYLSVERNPYAVREDTISNALCENGLRVPKRYKSFNTYHYFCIPMLKLDTTLLDIYQASSDGIGLDKTRSIIHAFVPVLQYLHKNRLCYVDFSCGNVAFLDGEPHMIDFGALHEAYPHRPIAKTIRYASINAEKDNAVDYMDDLQSLGFVICEALLGPSIDLDNKPLLIQESLDGKHGVFLRDYFSALGKNDPYIELLSL